MKTVACALLSVLVLSQLACQTPADSAAAGKKAPEEDTSKKVPEAPKGDQQGPELMAGLRNMALTMTPDQINVTVPSAGRGIWGSVTDFGSPDGTATLVTFFDGSTSLYFSPGGGIIGAGDQSEDVRKASRTLLEKLEQCSAQMEARPPQKLPVGDSVRFYVHTKDGLLSSAEIPASDLQASDHPLFPCYAAAMKVFTQVRLTSEKK